MRWLTLLTAVACTSPPPEDSGDGYVPGPMFERRYCEVLLVFAVDEGLRAEVWNSLPYGDCPQADWEQLDRTEIAAEYEALTALLNGPRFFLMDAAVPPTDLGEPSRTYGAIEMKLVARLQIDGANPGAYVERSVERDNVWTWFAGATVYELVAPDATYVMQSYARMEDPELTRSDLDGLAERIAPPEGWSYRVRVLDADLDVGASGIATVVQDELANTYQRIDP